MNYPEAEPSRYQAEEELIFSFMKTLGFQTFLLTSRNSFRLKTLEDGIIIIPSLLKNTK